MWLFWILIIIVIVLVMKAFTGKNNMQNTNEKSAMEILRQRYARGEIDQQEFEQKRKEKIRINEQCQAANFNCLKFNKLILSRIRETSCTRTSPRILLMRLN